MTQNVHSFLEAMMRYGYFARGVVYVIVGIIAAFTALYGGEAQGSHGAMDYLINKPAGGVMVGLIGVGFFSYAAFRFLDGVFNIEVHDGKKGALARVARIVQSIFYAGLAISAFSILKYRGDRSGGEDGVENWTAKLMDWPFGPTLVTLAGLVVAGVGVYLFYQAWKENWKKRIVNTRTTENLEPVIRYGIVAHGVVLLIIGGLMAYAGLVVDPDHAAGAGEAMEWLERQAFGKWLLLAVAIGTLAFAAYCFVEAVWRESPFDDSHKAVKLAAA